MAKERADADDGIAPQLPVHLKVPCGVAGAAVEIAGLDQSAARRHGHICVLEGLRVYQSSGLAVEARNPRGVVQKACRQQRDAVEKEPPPARMIVFRSPNGE